MIPDEYLAWRVRLAFSQHENIYKAVELKIGLRAILSETCVEIVCTNLDRFAASLPPDLPAHIRDFILDQAMNMPSVRTDLMRLRDRCIDLVGDRHRGLKGVPVGIAPIPLFNAGAGAVPSGGEIVILNEGLWALDTILAHFESVTSTGGVDFTHRAIPLSDIVRALSGGSPVAGIDQRPFLDPAKEENLARIRFFLLMFVLLHEYGHISLGHVETLRQWPPDSSLNREELLLRRAEMREWEHAADRWAASLIAHVCKTGPHLEGTAYLGHLFGILHLAHRLTMKADLQVATHPDGLARSSHVVSFLNLAPQQRARAEILEKFWCTVGAAGGIELTQRDMEWLRGE